MAKTFSNTFQGSINSTESDEFPKILLEIDHEALASPIRVCNDTDDITSNGNLFQRFPFRFSGIRDPENGLAEAQLQLDNVGRELVTWIEAANLRKPTTCKIMIVLASAPDNVEFETTMFLDDIAMDQEVVEGRLSYGVKLDEPGVVTRYTAQTAPGLFP